MKHDAGFVVDGYEFQIGVREDVSGKYWGEVLFAVRGDTDVRFDTPFLLTTYTAFKTIRGARIEAEAFAYEVIKTGSVRKFFPQASIVDDGQ